MRIAIIKNQKCINTTVFEDLETAQSFLTAGVFNADNVVELPDGFGIGDTYDGKWTKAEQPVEPPIEIDPDLVTESEALEILFGGLEEDV